MFQLPVIKMVLTSQMGIVINVSLVETKECVKPTVIWGTFFLAESKMPPDKNMPF